MTTARKEGGSEADAWVSLPAAARELGLTRQKVLQLAVKGVLTADVRGNWTFISRESIERQLSATK